ncbi:hypothetical protein ABPG75_004821 [Micractinium tetrahymenae]
MAPASLQCRVAAVPAVTAPQPRPTLAARSGARLAIRSSRVASAGSTEQGASEQSPAPRPSSSLLQTISHLDALLGVQEKEQLAAAQAAEAAAAAAEAAAAAAAAEPQPSHWADLPPEERTRRATLSKRRDALAARQQELAALQDKEERKANYHRQRAFVLARQQRELVAQQEELWAAMEPEAAAAYRARQEEELAAAEAATRRQFFQMGAATGVVFAVAAATEMGIAYEAADRIRERRQRALERLGGGNPLGNAIGALRERIAALDEPPF